MTESSVLLSKINAILLAVAVVDYTNVRLYEN